MLPPLHSVLQSQPVSYKEWEIGKVLGQKAAEKDAKRAHCLVGELDASYAEEATESLE